MILAAVVSAPLKAADTNDYVRLDQVGFCAEGSKRAFLMTMGTENGATFKILDSGGQTAFSGPVEKRVGAWNQDYTNVYLLEFSAITKPGVYIIEVSGPLPGRSPPFRIGSSAEIYAPLLQNAHFYFQAQRDGPEVPRNALRRQPSHLADARAFVYQEPAFGKNGLQGGLKKIGGPVDVSGGWFDAGDYLKFVETASYVTAVMLVAARDYPAQAGAGKPADFAAEGRFGLDWLLKMWRDDTLTLYCQVGIGDGNQRVTGDHDRWRLPEADDQLEVQPGAPDYFLKYRPVFPAGPPAGPVSPNLAGRLAASFALGYQVCKTTDPAGAKRLLLAAEHVFDLAATNLAGQLTTTYPRSFYPEEEWRDDLEWGAAELCLALTGGGAPTGLPHSDPAYYLELAAHWARAYLSAADTGGSVNLYDVSGLAHYELCRALDKTGSLPKLEVNRNDLVNHLKRRLESAVKRSANDPFGLGVRYGGGDLIPRILGLVLEAGFYDDLTHTATYADLAQRQLDFVLGANAWGTSFIVGAGAVFPRHLQHQVANLSGSLDGAAPVLLGATVDGPAPLRGKSKAGDMPDGARAAPWPAGQDPFAAFSGQGVQYLDDVSSWATVEPANDYTVPTVLIFARLAGR